MGCNIPLIGRPETFFTPSHTMLYAGIGLLVIAAVVGATLLLKNEQIRTRSFSTALRLLMIGSAISLVAGPSDYLWHQTFGVDGLLSPTHLTLVTGMLINCIAVVLGLARIIVYLPTENHKTLIKTAMIPAFAAMWLTMIWYVYMFALPLSNGQHFNFNLNPIYESIIAISALPTISSIVFITASRTIGRFGATTTVTALLLVMNLFANIIPSNQLMPFLPWYLMLIIPAVVSDLILNKFTIIRVSKLMTAETSAMIAGAIIGSIFYIIGYPMLPITFAEPLSYTFHSINDISTNFVRTLPLVFILTVGPGVALGIVGAILSVKKIKVPQTKKLLQATYYLNQEIMNCIDSDIRSRNESVCPRVTSQYKTDIRERIVQSGIECFSKYGFDKSRMDNIAQTADLSKGTVYLYFKSKEDLFYAICENNLKVIKEQISQIFATTKENLLSDAEQFYDNLQKLEEKREEKVFFEIVAESSRNTICRKYYMNKE